MRGDLMLETLTRARALVTALEAAQEALTSLGSVSTPTAPTEAEAAPTEPPVESPVAAYIERLRSIYVNPVGAVPDGMEIDPDDPPDGLRWGVFVELSRLSPRRGTACYSAYGTPSEGFDSLGEAVAAWRAWATVAGLLDRDGAAQDGWEINGDQFSVDRIEKGEF